MINVYWVFLMDIGDYFNLTANLGTKINLEKDEYQENSLTLYFSKYIGDNEANILKRVNILSTLYNYLPEKMCTLKPITIHTPFNMGKDHKRDLKSFFIEKYGINDNCISVVETEDGYDLDKLLKNLNSVVSDYLNPKEILSEFGSIKNYYFDLCNPKNPEDEISINGNLETQEIKLRFEPRLGNRSVMNYKDEYLVAFEVTLTVGDNSNVDVKTYDLITAPSGLHTHC